ncbi:MAG TPA: hypothetical protein VKF81_08710 [Blastocatellia bacterium]|nr:hypothetical protein [Blastocatellia bacterium]
MKLLAATLILSFLAGSSAGAQKRRKATRRSRSTPAKSAEADAGKPAALGSTVTIVTRNGDRLAGELLGLTAYSVRLRADNLESAIALDTIASLSFGSTPRPGERVNQSIGRVRVDFARDAAAALGLFQSLESSLKPGFDYTDYGQQLAELRRLTELFITKHSATDNPAEARVVCMFAAALNDYSWARTIWTLKFGRSGDGTVADTDSQVIGDVLGLYPDLRGLAATGNRLSVEKLLTGLWRKAAEQTDRARTLVAPAR